jgi:polysaccharide deacetylase family protein (PEP-CTERM system associated)
MADIINALSIDVEDWFQVGAFETTIARADWGACESRVVRNTDRLLDLFARRNVKATFFTLGWVAERHPDLIRRIVAAGHELASHGYDHQRVFTFTPEQFRADLRKSRALLEQAGAVPVRGYRAPSFSIDACTPWAHSVLAEEGYSYSSSVAPVRHDHYGWPEAPRFAYRPLADSSLIELPVTTARAFGRTLAAGGGGFFRLMPYGFTRWAVGQVNRTDQRPAIFYFHPWEIDADQPRVPHAPLKSRLRHYTNLATTEAKLDRLIEAFRWGRVDAVAADQARDAPCWPAA